MHAYRNYDCFTFTRPTVDGRDEEMEARRYDAGTDGGKGVYQMWQSESGSAISSEGWKHYENAWYVSTLTASAWEYRYGGLSVDAKQKFESERTARKAMKLPDGGTSVPWTAHTSITPGQKVSMLLARLKNI
jgi:hypothetical protein